MGTPVSEWPGPLAVADPAPIAELRAVLVDAGFDGPTVRDVLAAEGLMIARPGDAPVLRRRLAGIEPLGTIASLFVLGTPLEAAAVRRAFAPLRLERLEALGLVEADGVFAHPRVRLVPHDDLLIVSDVSAEGEQPDHVAGVHNPSLTLSHLTVRQPVATGLDVGTGCGIQAILASRHCEHVVATDLNERALNFAVFNALLNEAEDVELRAGSFFEPVAGERFELVVTNPPYVISPESEYLFRDSGLAGDSVSRQVVEAVPGALEEGAFATVLVSWIHPPGEDWSAPLRAWVAGSGCDALLLHYDTEDPLTHTANWTYDRHADDPDGQEEMLERWLAYFDELGVEGIGYGAVVLRRRDRRTPHVLAHQLPPGLRPAGDHIERLFAAADYLDELSDDRALLAERPTLVEAASVEQLVRLREGDWSIERIQLQLTEGLRFQADIDPLIAHLLAGLDGRRTVGEVATAVAEAQGFDGGALAERAVPVVREMIALGYLGGYG
jgi:methylase of polypeptide subunit release factors